MEHLRAQLADQAGVVSRRQLGELGLLPHDVRRLLRRRDLTPVHPGVYVEHTGPLTWQQRAWSAVLYAWPAALSGQSALRAEEGPGRRRSRSDGPIEVAVDVGRTLVGRPDVRVARTVGLSAKVRWNAGPPRLRYEEASLDVASRATSRVDAVAELAAGLQARRTTASRLRTALEGRARFPDRAWFADVLDDLASGACSTLEHGYLTLVERPHGLPRGQRQVRARATTGIVYRDTEYLGGWVVELDGRLFHDDARAWDVAHERDLDAAVAARTTLRLSYGQVFDRPCATAGRVALLLRRTGWTGVARPCNQGCALVRAA